MTLDRNRTVNMAVQALPLTEAPYPLLERAAAVTPLDCLLETARQAHLARMDAGAPQVVTRAKLGDRRTGTSIAEKVGGYRTT